MDGGGCNTVDVLLTQALSSEINLDTRVNMWHHY